MNSTDSIKNDINQHFRFKESNPIEFTKISSNKKNE